MTRRLVTFLVCAITLLIVSCGSRDSSDDNAARADSTFTPGPRPSAEAIASALDSLAARIVAEGLAPAIGVALVVDGRTILSRSYGMADVTAGIPATDSTLWYVASTSKSYTGFAVSLLAYQGVFGFDTPITTLLPDVQWPAGVDAGKLTLANFLSHTHNLNDVAIVTTAAFTGAIPESEWPSLIRYATPAPDQGLAYSNFGYNVAAMVIDAKRPEGWRRFLDSAIYRPAGLTQTFTRISGLDGRRIAKPHEILEDGRYVTGPFQKADATMNSAGGHLATLRDLARWVTVQCDGGMIDGKRAFPAEAVELSHRLIARQTRDQSKRFAFFDREGWAAGWDIGTYRGQPMVSRFGSYSRTRSHLSFLPGRHIGVVAETNGDLSSQATDIIAAFVYDLEMGDPAARDTARARLQAMHDRRPAALASAAEILKKHAARDQTLKRPLSDFAGSYRHEWYGTVKFEVRGDRLQYAWGVLRGDAEVQEAGDNVLRIEVGDTGNSVAFEFSGSGPATGFELRGEKFTRQQAAGR